MVLKSLSRVLQHQVSKLFLVVFMLFMFGSIGGVLASPVAQESPLVEPEAGSWATWVLESGSQFRLDAPPDDAATAQELEALQTLVANRDDTALTQIAYWNAGAPSLRWNQIALDALLKGAAPSNIASRTLALMHVAIYDATIAAWDSKYTYNRLRPSEVDPSLETVIANPLSPSYPSEYAVTAAAASEVLAWLFPNDAQMFADKAQEAVHSRLLAGVEYPSDVEAGLELGRQVAQQVIAWGQADGFDVPWAGSVPAEAGQWTGENPILPAAGTWKTWVLETPDQFRSEAPYAYDSEELAAEMQELREIERNPVMNSIAMFWEYGAGGRRAYWLWNQTASRYILQARLDGNAPLAARAYALTNIASHDASVACWDSKYNFWAMRPFQVDPEFTPLFTTPNHPSYPSAHSCISTATANVLAALFPSDAAEVLSLSAQASESRIYAGIHFRSDVEAGIALGTNVANAVLEHAASDGAE